MPNFIDDVDDQLCEVLLAHPCVLEVADKDGKREGSVVLLSPNVSSARESLLSVNGEKSIVASLSVGDTGIKRPLVP
jgi:hypothetical protein